jgi:hypothetical protein
MNEDKITKETNPQVEPSIVPAATPPQSAISPSAHGNAPTPTRKPGISWATSFFLIIAIMAALAWAIINQVISLPGGAVDKTAELAGKAKNAMVEVFNLQPRVISKTKVHYEQASQVLELAVLSRETLVEDEFEHQYLGSTKQLKLRGVYDVKSGFDLEQPFTATIDGEIISITLPPARILSVEQKNVEVLELSNGLWNKINAEDLEDQINTLAALARQKLFKEGLNQEAEKAVVIKLQEKLGPGTRIEVNSNPPAPQFPQG